jgi:hypothetical protein
MAGAKDPGGDNKTMKQYSVKKQKKELKRKRKRKIVRLEKLRETISKRRKDKDPGGE